MTTRSAINLSMNKCLGLVAAIGILLAGCSSRSQFPWSLEGKTIPTFEIATKEEVSAANPISFSLAVVVSTSLSKDELTTVSQKIIEDLPKHNLVVIFFFSDRKQVSGEYTVGKAWWGVNDDKNFPPPGDYSHHTLIVERK